MQSLEQAIVIHDRTMNTQNIDFDWTLKTRYIDFSPCTLLVSIILPAWIVFLSTLWAR